MNTIVVRYVDGRVAKGTTANFLPTKDRFNLFPDESAAGTRTQEILLREATLPGHLPQQRIADFLRAVAHVGHGFGLCAVRGDVRVVAVMGLPQLEPLGGQSRLNLAHRSLHY